jgi:hypothetical protein
MEKQAMENWQEKYIEELKAMSKRQLLLAMYDSLPDHWEGEFTDEGQWKRDVLFMYVRQRLEREDWFEGEERMLNFSIDEDILK